MAASLHKKKPKRWIQATKMKRGAFRDMLGMPPGEPIPEWVKQEGCRNPRLAFYHWFKRIPTRQEARLFQKRACFAGTLGGLSKRKRMARKAA